MDISFLFDNESTKDINIEIKMENGDKYNYFLKSYVTVGTYNSTRMASFTTKVTKKAQNIIVKVLENNHIFKIHYNPRDGTHITILYFSPKNIHLQVSKKKPIFYD